MSAFETIQAIRGMHDVLPSEVLYWQRIESVCKQVAKQYAYREIRFPIVEQTQLFKRGIGDVTDIVEKEMYTFEDRNGDSLTLRPEGTASCVRAGIEHGLLFNQIQRFWYLGPMFRHERPQKGRSRQFHQFSVEVFGLNQADIDVEIILLAKRICDQLGLSQSIQLELNTVGTLEQRTKYREKLVAFFHQHQNKLDEECRQRLIKNPLRILDSKNPDIQNLIQYAPKLIDCIDGEAKAHFDRLCELLTLHKVNFKINPCLVRGLDYYSFTVFEWITAELGAQGTVCGGGRYNGLVEMLGGKATPAIGFSIGLERMALLLEAKEKLFFSPDFYIVSVGHDAIYHYAFLLAEKIRDQFKHIKIEMDADHGSFKNQLKRADKNGAKFAIIIGDSEFSENKITLKDLRNNAEQKILTEVELLNFVRQL